MKRTILERTEEGPDGTLYFRFACYDDAGDRHWHRTSLPPGHSLTLQMQIVNAHLERLKKAPVEAAEIGKMEIEVSRYHTAEKIAAYQSREQ